MSGDPAYRVIELFNAIPPQPLEALKVLEGIKNDISDDYYKFLKGCAIMAQIQPNTEKNKQIEFNTEALKLFEDSWKANQEEENQDALFRIAVCLNALDRNEEALPFIEQCIQFNYNLLSDCYFYRGQAYKSRKEWAKAILSYAQAIENLETFPMNDDYLVYLCKSVCHFNAGEVKEAIEDGEKALKKNSTDPEIQTNLGNYYIEDKQYDKAQQLFDKLLAKDKTNMAALLGQVKILKKQEKFDESLQLLEKITAIDKTNTQAFQEIGNVYFKKGEWQKAVDAYSEVLKTNKDDVSALNNKGVSLKHLKKLKEAAECLEQATKINPKDCDALINLGSMYDELKDYQKAIDTYKAAIAINADNSDAFNNLGIAYKHVNNIQEAENAFDLAIQKDNLYILAYTNKAQVQQMLGRQPEALVCLKQASELLKNPEATSKLQKSNIDFIKQSVQGIIQLEEQFGQKAKLLEEELKKSQSATKVSPQRKKILDEFISLKQQKAQSMEKQLESISQPKQENQQQSQKELTAVEKEMLRRADELEKLLRDLKDEQEELKEDVEKNQKQIEEQKQETIQIKQVLKDADIYDKAKVKQWFRDNEGTEKYNYCKAFYWTLLNYFDAYRVASTNVMKKNINHTEDSKQNMGVKFAKGALSVGKELAKGIPLIGNIFSLIDKAIDCVYAEVKEKRFEDRVKSITKIIMENKTADMAEDLSLVITKAAQEIAGRKEEILEEKMIAANNVVVGEKSAISKAFAYLSQKVQQIKVAALGKEILMYESVGGTEALQDVILVLATMQKNYEAIIKDSKEIALDQQIADMVIKKQCYEILNKLKIPDVDDIISGDDLNTEWDAERDFKDTIDGQAKGVMNVEQKEEKKEKKEEQEKGSAIQSQVQQTASSTPKKQVEKAENQSCCHIM